MSTSKLTPVETRAFRPLLFIGPVLALLLILIGRLPQRLEAHPIPYVPVFLAAFLAYVFAVRRIPALPPTRRTLLLILGFGVLFRLIAVLQPPSLSTDIWRYVWDGHIGHAGINPYRYPPSHSALTAFRTDYWGIINHPTWVTMYPPLSQRIFTGLTALGAAGPYAFKAVFALADLGIVGMILLVLRRAGLPLNRVLVYAWHPLVVMELSGSGHQDVLGIFFMLVAVCLIRHSETPREGLLGGLGGGLSLMSKGYLLPALPVFARKRPVWFALALGVTVAALMLPYMGHGSQIQEGMNRYLQNRLRNAGVFAWTYGVMYLFVPNPLKATRLLMTATLGPIVLALAWRPWRDERELMGRSNDAMGAFFLLSHTVYPWYATWLVPGLCLRLSPGWLLWSGLISLAYLNPVPWKNPWIPYLEYLPVLAVLAWQGWGTYQDRGKRKERRALRGDGCPA